MNARAEQQNGGHNIKLHLHIGTEKTGTTSFQNWLKAEQANLEARGIIWPSWPSRLARAEDHRVLSTYAQGFIPADDWQKRMNITTLAKYDALRDEISNAFSKEINNRGDGEWIISGEHMQSRLVRGDQVKRLATFLTQYFSEIIVYIHLRPQVDLARSIVSTSTRLGRMVTEKNFETVTDGNPYYNYAALVERWEAGFGKAKVRLISYKRERSIRSYFLDLWKLDAKDFGPELAMNRAVDWRTIALMNTIIPHRNLFPERMALQRIVGTVPVITPLHIGLTRAREITECMRPSNEVLVQGRDDISMQDLTPDWDRYDHPENLSRLTPDCEFSAQAASVMSELQCELFLEKARNHVLNANSALLAGKRHRAKVRLEDANELLLQIEPMWKDRWRFIQLRNQMAKIVLDGLD